jgi:hypothetical protein
MGHHHTARPPHSHAETMERVEDATVPASRPQSSDSHAGTNRQERSVSTRENTKTIFDYEIGGWPLTFVIVIAMIAIGVLGLVLKVMGVV